MINLSLLQHKLAIAFYSDFWVVDCRVTLRYNDSLQRQWV